MTAVSKTSSQSVVGTYRGVQNVYGYLPGGGYGILRTDTYETTRATGVNTTARSYDNTPKPKGFRYPTAYNASFKSGDTLGPPHIYASGFSQNSSAVFTVTGAEGVGGYFGLGSLSSFDERATKRAALKILENLKGQKVNLAVAFAERKQTADLFSTTVRRLTAGVEACKKGNIKGLKKAFGLRAVATKEDLRILGSRKKSGSNRMEVASSLFLENRYGWVPLLSDITGAAQLLAEKDISDPNRYDQSFKGSARFSATEENFNNPSQTSWWAIPLYLDIRIQRKWGAFYRCDAYLENPALHAAAKLGLLNPAIVAWEKLPWSFVADWVVPIGSYLNSMDAVAGWRFRAGSISRKTDEDWTVMVRPRQQGGWGTISASGTGKSKQSYLSRSVLSDFPSYAIADLIPKNPLSTGHVLNAVALLAQSFLK